MCFNQEPLSLEEVCKLITDGSHFSPTPQTEGYPIVNAKDIPNGYINLDSCTKISRTDWETLKKQNCAPVPGDVLLSKDGTIGRVVHYKSDLGVVTLSSIAILRPRDFIDSCYLAQILRSEAFRKQLLVLESGSALRRIILRDIKKLKFCFPENRAEQTKIAKILSVVDRAIEKTEAMIAKQHRIKAGLMQDLLTRGIDEHGNLRSEQTHKFKESPLGRIPVEWDVTDFGSRIESSAFGPRFPSTAYSETGNLAMLRTTDLDNFGNIAYEQMPRATLDVKTFKYHLLKAGDLLISRSGTIGITTVFDGFNLPTIPGAFIIRFRMIPTLAISSYWRAYFNWDVGRHRLVSQAEGGVQKNLRGSAVNKMIMAFPDISEQRKVTVHFDRFDAEIKMKERQLAKLRSLKTALMQDLLTGKKRVTCLLEPVSSD